MQEQVCAFDAGIRIELTTISAGTNVRRVGDDFKAETRWSNPA